MNDRRRDLVHEASKAVYIESRIAAYRRASPGCSYKIRPAMLFDSKVPERGRMREREREPERERERVCVCVCVREREREPGRERERESRREVQREREREPERDREREREREREKSGLRLGVFDICGYVHRHILSRTH